MAVLKVNNLSKSFGGIEALKDINLEVHENEIIGLIGQNGAGKTTFFNLLTGIYAPTSGEIEYNLGKRITSRDLKPHKTAGYGISRTFQNIRLFQNMTVMENVLLGYHTGFKYGLASSLFKLPSRHKDEYEHYERSLNLLKEFKLLDKKDVLARNLSYGEQRRLEIARALAANPKVLLLDEPAAGMNPNETKELTSLIRWIRETFDLTVILIEHDMSLVMKVCERIFVFDSGRLIAEGTPDEISRNQRVIKAYLGEEA